jgi:folate-binding protein YgfZ
MYFRLYQNDLEQTSACFSISGPDAYTYLQGQFTQDLNRPPGAACYGLWLNQKGRVLADSFVLRRAEREFLVVSFTSPADALRQRLESYLVADEVEIADMTAQWARVGVWGNSVADRLDTVPLVGSFFADERGIVFAGRASRLPSFELLVPRASVDAWRAKLTQAGLREADDTTAARERILSGIPAVPIDIGPNDLPAEGGLDETAISFTKGCYLGQEVMARLKNLGQVRRRLHVIRGPGLTPVSPMALYQGGKKIGETRSTAPDGDGFVAMAMLSLVNLNVAKKLSLNADGAADFEVVQRV